MARKFWRLKILAVTLVLGMAVISCNDGSSGGTGTVRLLNMDIANANTLLITASTNNIGAVSRNAVNQNARNQMFKITDVGHVLEVVFSYEDENGNIMTSTETFTPIEINDINDDFLMVVFGRSVDSHVISMDYAYLVRKIDGAAFQVDIPILDIYRQSGNFINASPFQTDRYGNIYYQYAYASRGGVRIVRISVGNGGISRMDYLPALEIASWFAVSPEGHVIYGYGTTHRIRTAGGRIHNLRSSMGESFFIGLAGNIKYLTQQDITTFVIDSNDNLTETTVPLAFGSMRNSTANQLYILQFAGRILIAGRDSVYEIEGVNPREIILHQIIIDRVYQSGSFYYVVGQNSGGQPVLLQVSPVTDAVTNLLPPGTHIIQEFSVNERGEITFSATRMSDGNTILGNISALGNVEIIREELNYRLTALERIR